MTFIFLNACFEPMTDALMTLETMVTLVILVILVILDYIGDIGIIYDIDDIDNRCHWYREEKRRSGRPFIRE